MPSAPSRADVPSAEEIEAASAFIREPVLLGEEDASTTLAPNAARRHAIDEALAERSEGLPAPSTRWRRRWSLLLGLERMLSVEEPMLADGTTTLGGHQVDALSGTLTALLTEEQAHSPFAPERPAPEQSPADRPERRSARRSSDADAEADADAPTEAELHELDAMEPDEGDDPVDVSDVDQLEEQEEDPNAAKRFWFEHATGAGKTVAAMGFVDACRLGGVLILTHRRNLVEQFTDEIKTRGYADRLSPPLLKGEDPVAERNTLGPVTVETYQWFVRHAGEISSAYTIVICDEAHTALGEKTSAAIRAWTGPIFIGMTATGALIARHVADLFPTQTSRFDLAQAARRGVIAPLRCVRIPPGVGVRTIAKVPLRRGEVDMEFDQDMLAEVLDQLPFNLAAADLYKTRFGGMAGVVYAAGVKHAYNLAEAFEQVGIKAKAVSGETPKRELSRTLADYEAGKIDVLVNAQLLAEGWNSPRATVCLHLAPTASKRIYQQRVGRVTRREPDKEAGIVVDFVHPGTKHDDPVVTLHSLLERDVYRGGAIVVGPVRRGRGRRVRVERRILPVCVDQEERLEIFRRDLWRIAVEHLDYGEQVQWAAIAGSKVGAQNWRKARAMLHFDKGGELKRAFLVTAIKHNPNHQVKLKAITDIAALRDADAFADAVDELATWPKDERRDGVRTMLQAIADKPIGRRDQVSAWIWQLASATADEHEEYATQRFKDGKRLLGLLVNSAGPAHGRNARRLVQASREQDRRTQAAMLAAARPHTPEAMQVITGARTRMARKPGALARDLLRNLPKGKADRKEAAPAKAAREPKPDEETLVGVAAGAEADASQASAADGAAGATDVQGGATSEPVEYEAYTFESEAAEHASEKSGGKRRRSRNRRRRKAAAKRRDGGESETANDANAATDAGAADDAAGSDDPARDAGASADTPADAPVEKPARRRTRSKAAKAASGADEQSADAAEAPSEGAPTRRTRAKAKPNADEAAAATETETGTQTKRKAPAKRKTAGAAREAAPTSGDGADGAPADADAPGSGAVGDDATATVKRQRRTRRKKTPEDPAKVTDAIAAAAAALKGEPSAADAPEERAA